MSTEPNQDELLKPAETAQILRVTPQALAYLRFQGKGPVYLKLEGRILYRKSDVEAYIKASVVVPNSGPRLEP